MADDIRLKRSDVSGLVPDAGELLDGELAINTADGKLYAKAADGSVFVVNPDQAVRDIQSGGENVLVDQALGVVTISVLQEQADWDAGIESVSHIANKPTALSDFDNDSAYVDAEGASAAAPVQDILQGGAVVVTSEAGVYTVSAPGQIQADWGASDTSAVDFIKNKPTALSEFENDEEYVDAAGAAAAAPIQSITSPDSSVSIVSASGGEVQLSVASAPKLQSDWSQADTDASDFIKNKPTALSEFSNDEGYVNADQAADAAPVQDLTAGANVTVVRNDGVYEISADIGAYVQSVTGTAPIVVTGSGSNPVVGVSQATDAQFGVVQLASESDVVGGASGRVVDAAQLKAAIPSALSQLSNDSGFVTQAAINQSVASYLPLTGGVISGSFVVSPSGSAQAPTPAIGDSSASVATTEWVQRELTGVVESTGIWAHGGGDTTTDPTSGFLRVSGDGLYLAISKYSADDFVPAASSLPVGALVVLEVVPPQLASEDGSGIDAVSGFAITTE